MSQTRSSGPDRPRTSRTAPRRAGAASRSSVPVLDRPAVAPAADVSATGSAAPGSPNASSGRRSPSGSSRSAAKRSVRARRTAPEAASPRPPRPSALAIVRAPRHRLLVVCTAVLATGMLCVLLLNTMISQGAFRQHELELALIHASEAEEQLSRQVQLAEAPLAVERAARALGMVPAAAPVFLRLSDGAVLGDPVPAAPAGKVSFAGAPGWQTPKPRPSGSPSASTGAQPSAADVTAPAAPAAAGSAAATTSGGGTPQSKPAPTATPVPAPSAGAGARPTPRAVAQ